jgi:hypothetical protein
VDIAKCESLKEEFRNQPEPQLVSITRFFEGNDDLGSIGCNLIRHPGINVFRDTLIGLLGRPDVNGVYAQISELDPGQNCWPFTDTVLVVGKISVNELSAIVGQLEPDEVYVSEESDEYSSIGVTQECPARVIWWD